MPDLPAHLVPGPNGHPIGRDPRDMTAADFAACGIEPTPVLAAIRAKCLDCCGGNPVEVRRCVAHNCALWPFRTNKNPFRSPREISDEKRAAIAERLARGRARAAGSADADQ